MKKFFTTILAFFSLIALVACSPKTEEPTAETGHVQLIVQAEKGQTDERVEFTQGQTVLEILQANYDVEETNGMVTSIDGVAQDASKNIYWMYKVNDEMAAVGAGELEPKDGDKIEFYQEQFD